MLRSFWGRFFKYDNAFGWALILFFGIPRFILVLIANQTQRYGPVSIIFLLMWAAPFVFLTKAGRTSIGIKKPTHYHWLIFSFLIGIAVCVATYYLGLSLYGLSVNNWFVYISRSYPVRGIIGPEKQIYFLIFAITSMTFSPLGEELLYRGIIHGSFTTQFSERKASIIDSSAFAITHLAHFGIVFISGSWVFLPVPALWWVLVMFGASQLFFLSKLRTGSIWGAVFCHAGFNLAMTWFIFYRVL